MTDATVTVNNLNLNQGAFKEVERKALFIAPGAGQAGAAVAVNNQSDIEKEFGAGVLATQLKAAQANGGQNWFANACRLAEGSSWQTSLNSVIENVDPELIAIGQTLSKQADLQAVKTAMEALRTKEAKRCIALVAVPGIDPVKQTWADYVAAMDKLQKGLSAPRLALVPQLHGNDLGVLAGRLCRHEQSIADSPQRVATGSIFDVQPAPADKDGVLLTSAVLKDLRSKRLNCVKRFTGKDGVFWGNFNTLDAEAGDYQNGEWLRIADKAARAVRILSIGMIDNRQINSSPASVAYTQRVLLRPLLAMASATKINGIPFPGEILAPGPNAIVVHWVSKTVVEFYISLQPVGAPKIIKANILLDLALAN